MEQSDFDSITTKVPESGKADSAYSSPSYKEKVHQGEPLQGFQVLGSGETISTHTSSSSNLEETEHQVSKPDVLGQPSTSGVKEGEISLRPQKGPKWVDTNNAGAGPNDVRRWYDFGALASICTVAPGFREISKLPDWVLNAVVESWHNNPHLKRGDELEIKFIIVASEDMTNTIQYPSFHFMKL
ncbi:hypothetical protein ACS0TY_034102 [Phlomoides rotata]